jgi:hypothetical protein
LIFGAFVDQGKTKQILQLINKATQMLIRKRDKVEKEKTT